jgi:hypothetical protein
MLNRSNDLLRRTELLNKRFSLNMSRVNRLVGLAERLKKTTDQDHPDELADLYRSTVVFLYASFEDMLRTTADIHLSRRAEERTYGNVTVVVKVLGELGLDPAPFRPLFPEMATLMARRHRIVHEADLSADDAVTDAPWTIGDHYKLSVWIFVVTTFVSRLRVTLDPSQIVDEWFAERGMEILRKLAEARQALKFSDSFEETKQSVQTMADTLEEILTILKRPSDEVARTIADRHGIPYQS